MSKRSRFAFLLFSPAGWLACYRCSPFAFHASWSLFRASRLSCHVLHVERGESGCRLQENAPREVSGNEGLTDALRGNRSFRVCKHFCPPRNSKVRSSSIPDFYRSLDVNRDYCIEEEEKIFLKNHKLGKINIGLVAKIIRKAKILLETTKWRKNKANILTPVPTGGWFTPRRKPVHHEFFDRPIPSCGQYEIRPRHTRFFSPSPLPFFCRLVSVTRDSRLLAFESLKLILMGIFMAVGEPLVTARVPLIKGNLKMPWFMAKPLFHHPSSPLLHIETSLETLNKLLEG